MGKITFLIVGVLTTSIMLDSLFFLHNASWMNESLWPNKSLLSSFACTTLMRNNLEFGCDKNIKLKVQQTNKQIKQKQIEYSYCS